PRVWCSSRRARRARAPATPAGVPPAERPPPATIEIRRESSVLGRLPGEHKRLWTLAARAADPRFEAAVGPARVADHLREVVRRVLERRAVGGHAGQHELARPPPLGLGVV